METRVYAISIDDLEVNPNELSDLEFISESEKQGFVFSLRGFQDAFNNGEVSDEWFIRFI